MENPKHIAISLDDISDWCRKNNIRIDDGCKRYFELLDVLLRLQVRLNIPIFTVYLLPENAEKSDNFIMFSECLADFFNELLGSMAVQHNKIKISIFGKWYNLPGKAVEALKDIIEKTKDYDSFFANLCINYNGQEEIVDACKLIAKQVELEKLDHEMITKDTIKENIYSSYFLAPDIILIYGERKMTGLLLWDSANSRIEFADKSFMEFEELDIENLIHNIFKHL